MSTRAQLLPNGRVLRYTFHERVIHWVAGFSYVYLMLTGLAFWSPWLFWMAIVFGGATVSRELHPVGLIFVVSMLLMYRFGGADARNRWIRSFWHAIRITSATRTTRFPRPGGSTQDRNCCSGDFSGAGYCCFFPA